MNERQRALALWADWFHNGWDRPDDDLQRTLAFTDEEQRVALEWSNEEREARMVGEVSR